MSPLSGSTGVTTGSNVAYGVIDNKVHSSGYLNLSEPTSSGAFPPQPQSGEGEYEVPGPPKKFPAAPAMSPPALAPSQDREGGTQEEAVYEPV